ncbi:hypothetical protein EYF80_062462 [Liparis tanakae]|uniref:Uncharacterized protein n=1 Tax=Liparis tanakae TaxID=230148 RepID=A0A4Z2EG03_9TELE|nr:hypothetical protein EYF80_062462 [Liparis tanakae]
MAMPPRVSFTGSALSRSTRGSRVRRAGIASRPAAGDEPTVEYLPFLNYCTLLINSAVPPGPEAQKAVKISFEGPEGRKTEEKNLLVQ